MKYILIIGAGRSSSSLIKYLIEKSEIFNYQIIIADFNIKLARYKTLGHPRAKAIFLDVSNKKQRQKIIKQSSIVISMLPSYMHMDVAHDCLLFCKNLVTASYISDQMRDLDKKVREKGLLFMNEIGLDPGIDHMSSMRVIDDIRENKGNLFLFKSFTGGLLDPKSDNNLWNYKFTWNPRGVVLAGQEGAAQFIEEGKYKYIPYHKLFLRTEIIQLERYGKFEAYANRDSLKYKSVYGLDNISTLYRGTLRRVGFSRAWNIFVQLGMTDNSYIIKNGYDMTYRDFVNLFLYYHPSESIEIKLRSYLKIDKDDDIWDKLIELDLFSKTKTIGIENPTPAQALEKILTNKWTLKKNDKDMIVMIHKFAYEKDKKQFQIESSMVVKGDDQTYTSMAKTVGLPIAIATTKLLEGEIEQTGIKLPTTKEIYTPILKELEENGIEFNERQTPYIAN